MDTLNFMVRRMIKNTNEANKGKIVVYPSGYIYSDKGATNRQGVHIKAHPSRVNGRLISLTLVSTAFNCPKPPIPDAVQTDRGGFNVPMKACRKCEHHLKGNYCAELRRLRADHPNGAVVVAEAVAETVEAAKAKVQELMGK